MMSRGCSADLGRGGREAIVPVMMGRRSPCKI
jgi:hypothetical protein